MPCCYRYVVFDRDSQAALCNELQRGQRRLAVADQRPGQLALAHRPLIVYRVITPILFRIKGEPPPQLPASGRATIYGVPSSRPVTDCRTPVSLPHRRLITASTTRPRTGPACRSKQTALARTEYGASSEATCNVSMFRAAYDAARKAVPIAGRMDTPLMQETFKTLRFIPLFCSVSSFQQ